MSEQFQEAVEDIEVTDKVVFTDSDYSRPNWEGYTFEVEKINGLKYLDLSQISLNTPKDKFIISDEDAQKRTARDQTLAVPITVSKKDVIDDMQKEHPEFNIDTSASDEKIFAQVVLEMSNIYNGKYSGKLPSTREASKQAGVSWNTMRKFLHVAETAGLFVLANRGKIIRKPPKKEPEALKFIQDFEDWKKERPIEEWMEDNRTANLKTNQDSLFQAMTIMQVTPEKLKAMAQIPDGRKAKIDIGNLMEAPRFPDPRSEKNIAPKEWMEDRDGFKWQLPKTLMTGNKNTKGAWYWVKFGLQGKPKVWYYKTPDADPNEYANKKWSLRKWSNSPDAPDVEGYDKEIKIKNKKKAKVFRGTPRVLTKEAIDREDENVFYNFVGVIRQFVETFGLGIGQADPESVWAQVANPPRSATIHMTVDQIEAMRDCLAEGMKGNILEFDDYYNYYTPKEKKITFKDAEDSKQYWKECYFYFLLSLELGFRAEEAFTIVGEKTEVVESTDKSGKSGVIEFDNGDVMVQIYTRKGEHGKKGQKIHGGFIMSDETKGLIKERMREIEKGMDSDDPAKFGVVQVFENQPYKENSLIGASGKYTEIGTLDLPASQYGEKGKGVVKPVNPPRDKIREMLRHCYQQAKLKEPYWYDHSLHSLRHVFAQYWLELSDYNYGFVATIGHWKTESIVKEVYGKSLGAKILQTMKKFATTDPMKRLRELKQEREKAPSQAEKVAIEQTYHDTEKDLELKDLKLRQKVFFEGGEYYDVRVPEAEREIISYPKGTDIQVSNKDTELKSFFKIETQADKDTEEGLKSGE